MNLTSPSQVKAWCIENGFHPNKVLGQNFLIDRNALESIVDAAELPDGARVLEIGPGLGVLTEEMLRRGFSVTAIEKDPVLAERLAAALGNPSALEVRTGDALDFIKDGSCDGFPALVSNLPYQAGTRILLELAQRKEGAPETATVLVQTGGRVGAAGLRRQDRPRRLRQLLLAAPGNRIVGCAPRAPPPQRRTSRRDARSLPPHHQTGVRT